MRYPKFFATFKGLLLLSLILNLAIFTQAQSPITYTSDDFGAINEEILVTESITGLSDFDFTETGVNYTWAYNGLTFNSQSQQEFKSAENTGYKDAWCIIQDPPLIDTRFGTPCTNEYNLAFNLALSGIDDINLGDEFSISNVVNHYNKSTSSLELKMKGGSIDIGIPIPVVLEYEQPDEIYQFPMEYDPDNPVENTGTLSFDFDYTYAGENYQITYIESIVRTNTVEGWGTIELPMGSFDVLKLKSVEEITYTLIIDDVMRTLPPTTLITYSWFAKEYDRPVLEASGIIGNDVNITSIKYIDNDLCLNPTPIFGYVPADFDSETLTADILFINNSLNADEYEWDFGDDSDISTLFEPTHTYSCPGTFNVTLTAKRTCGDLNNDDIQLPVLVTDLSDRFSSSTEQTICNGSSYTLPEGSIIYQDPGRYTEVFPTDAGCDSTVTLLLNVLGNESAVEWTGTTSSNWGLENNWLVACKPAETYDVVINASDNDPIISDTDGNNGNVILERLTIEENATLTISSGANLSVNNVLSVDDLGNLIIEDGGSLITNGSIVGNVTVIRNTTFEDGRYSIVGSPVEDETANVLGNLVYEYDPDINDYQQLNETAILEEGKGYFSAFTGEITFNGKPNSGTITDNLLDRETFYLIANPYPAAISYSEFILQNNEIFGAIYLWDDGGSNNGQRSSSDYITINSMGKTGGAERADDWDGYIRSGQGFFVQTIDQALPSITFTEEMRVLSNNSSGGFFRSSSDQATLKLHAETDDYTYNEIIIGLNEDATIGEDRLYDARHIFPNDSLQFASILNNEPYAIQGFPKYFEESITVEIEILNPDNKEVILSISEFENLEPYEVTLYDSHNSAVLDLSLNASYAFGVNSNESRLLYLTINSSNVLGSLEQSNDYLIYQDFSGVSYLTSNTNTDLQHAVVYNLSGSLVKHVYIGSDGLQNSQPIELGIFNSGVYLLLTQTGSDVKSTKFLVK